MMSHSVFLPDEAATLRLGGEWARVLAAPTVAYLSGSLGAGKTTFARGLLRGLGFDGAVKSPTYAVVESYRLSELTVHHFDLYRFSSPEEWVDAGLDDVVAEGGICLIEWAQHGGGLVPPADLLFEFAAQDDGRVCSVSALSAQGQRSLNLWQK